MKTNKRAFTLIEVMIVICLMSVALGGFGFKCYGLIEKKRFSSQVNKLYSRLQTLHLLSLSTGRDYSLSLRQEKKSVICRSFFLKEGALHEDTPLTIEGVQLILALTKSDRLDIVFYSNGRVQSSDGLHLAHKSGEIKICIEDFFSQTQGKKMGPIYPKI